MGAGRQLNADADVFPSVRASSAHRRVAVGVALEGPKSPKHCTVAFGGGGAFCNFVRQRAVSNSMEALSRLGYSAPMSYSSRPTDNSLDGALPLLLLFGPCTRQTRK